MLLNLIQYYNFILNPYKEIKKIFPRILNLMHFYMTSFDLDVRVTLNIENII